MGSNTNKFIWLLIFFVAVVFQAANTNFAYAFGALIAWFIAGMALTPIWWGIRSARRSATPWQWFDWLNAGSYIMVFLQILNIVVRTFMRSQFGV